MGMSRTGLAAIGVCAGSLFTAAVQPAYAGLFIVPQAYATTEAGSAHSTAFNTGSRTEVIVIDNSVLAAAGILPGTDLEGISFRANGGTGPSPAMSFSNYDVKLGVAALSAATASTVFANNVVGGDPGFTILHTGALSLPAGYFSGGATPNAFALPIAFSSSYYYSGAGQGLVLEITHTAGTNSEFLDSFNITGTGSISGITGFSATSDTATSQTGTNIASTTISVLAFDVPEPATFTVLGLGVLALAGARRRQGAARPLPL